MWIVGNHDPGFADHCGGTLAEEVEVAGSSFATRRSRDDPRPEMSGHFHPKLRVNLQRPAASRAAASSLSPTKLILPAYGSLTGGLDAHHPEIIGQVGLDAAALVPVIRSHAALPDRGLNLEDLNER